MLSLAVFHSLYVWTVFLTDADRATHSPMGSLCPVLTLSPEPAAVAKEKGAVGVFWFGQGALIVSVVGGKNRRYRTGSGAVSGENSVWDGQKKGLERV